MYLTLFVITYLLLKIIEQYIKIEYHPMKNSMSGHHRNEILLPVILLTRKTNLIKKNLDFGFIYLNNKVPINFIFCSPNVLSIAVFYR